MSRMTTKHGHPFDRSMFESVMKRRFFYTESFEIYRVSRGWNGDNKGLYDYGPPGCALQANIIEVWRRHFVLEENMLELDCSVITPEPVLKTSGHVDKFADCMCKDPIKGDYLRADHLVSKVLEARLENDSKGLVKTSAKLDEVTRAEYTEILAKIDSYDGDGLGELIKRLDIRNPNGNGEVPPPIPFNLMFKSTVRPSSAAPVYLRPETAQGQFLNFKKLLDCNQGTMPFASASVGKSYRNEISPRSGLLRVREFLMGEIEHFVDPDDKSHVRFSEVVGTRLPLLDRQTQLSGSTILKTVTIEDAVEAKIIDNQTLGYFLAKIFRFLVTIGCDESKIRLRQHMATEMAHYACDCWDAELLTSYGWVECVGCADRSAYDLTVHSSFTGADLKVKEALHGGPVRKEVWQATLNKKLAGPKFKKEVDIVQKGIDVLDQSRLRTLASELSKQGVVNIETPMPMADGRQSIELSNEILAIRKEMRLETTREYTPSVIAPSFGIGRILYSLLEHVYWYRPQDTARVVLSLPIAIAPTKVLIVAISAQSQFIPIIRRLSTRLRALGISNNVDNTGASLGKRYARNDELGTPLGITIDHITLKDGSVTLRERDSTDQVRGSEDEVIRAVKDMASGVEPWEEATRRLPSFAARTLDNP